MKRQENEHEAMLYEQLADEKVRCRLCPWNCVIAPEHVGICGVRKNVGGKLFSIIYGRVSSIAVDPIEKKPLFHFYPGSKVLSLGTIGCNMHCGHCQNWQISHVVAGKGGAAGKKIVSSGALNLEYVPPEDLIALAKESDCSGIAWTYNEPTIWFEYALKGAKLAKENGLYTVFVTNGYINPEALDMIGPCLDAYRVDIKGFKKELYFKLARVRDFQPVLNAAEQAKKKWKMHVEIVTLVIPTMNDDHEQLKGIAGWIKDKLGAETPWHLTRFMPYLEYDYLPPTPVETLEKARELGLGAGLKFVYIGNVPGHEGENTLCPKCNKLIIRRTGYATDVIGLSAGKCSFCGEDLDFTVPS